MSGYQVVVIGEPHKDAWFGYLSELWPYIDKLHDEGYRTVARLSTLDAYDLWILSEPE